MIKNITLEISAPGVLANDTDPDGQALTAVLYKNPTHGTVVLNSNGSFRYTPNTGYIGSDSFAYKANDGFLLSNVATAYLRVKAPSLLLANYPNPFNPETWIPYRLSTDTNVEIMIYSVSGQLVRRLDLGYKSEGSYTQTSESAYWDGRNEVGEEVSSGVYFYTIKAGDYTATRKMLMQK